MRKWLACLAMASMMILIGGAAYADDTGIMIIGGSGSEAETVNMDDMEEAKVVKIVEFGNIWLYWEFTTEIVTDQSYYSGLGQWYATDSMKSGPDAQYLMIRIHILNTQKESFDFMSVFGDVICTFGEDYQFGGWVRQERRIYYIQNGKQTDESIWTMYKSADSSYSIASLYDGWFDVVVTLPNYVVNSKEPLSVTFSIGDNEFTCNIRK